MKTRTVPFLVSRLPLQRGTRTRWGKSGLMSGSDPMMAEDQADIHNNPCPCQTQIPFLDFSVSSIRNLDNICQCWSHPLWWWIDVYLYKHDAIFFSWREPSPLRARNGWTSAPLALITDDGGVHPTTAEGFRAKEGSVSPPMWANERNWLEVVPNLVCAVLGQLEMQLRSLWGGH